LSSREDELHKLQMVQEVHAHALKKREEELAAREMNLLGREISIIIQVYYTTVRLLRYSPNSATIFSQSKSHMARHAIIPASRVPDFRYAPNAL